MKKEKYRYKSNAIPFYLQSGIFFSILFLVTSIWIYASPYSDSLINVIGIYGNPYSYGVFDSSGGGGNGGRSIFVEESLEASVGGDVTYLDTSTIPQKLTGNYFVESVGWVNFDNVELIPPANMSAMTPWSLSGYTWSENAGYIDFSTPTDNSYDGVSYTPGTKVFSGFAWSENLGYLAFTEVSVNTDFKNKTKILGNIGGKRAFDIEYTLGVKFSNVNTSEILNSIRKNIGLMTRNIQSNHMNTVSNTNNFLESFTYYKGIDITDPGTKLSGNHLKSVIVEGGNIYIDNDVIKDNSVDAARAIIAIKDENGNGGNIYIAGNVRNIYSSLVAEGSIYSGDQNEIYNIQTSKLTQLPKNQLYILGAVISRNTIGGSSLSPNPVCPYTETNCNYSNSYKYDFNYFRSYDPLDSGSLGSDKTGYSEYSVIIESDPKIQGSPPPGLDNI
ncbi:MAG: hypothetical protein HHAS10_03690 [Candidatus Altimarinota bacterium]